MHIINLTQLEEGVYNDHKTDHIAMPPQGWAMIPDDMVLPSTFPRLGSITAEEIAHPYEVLNEETGETETKEHVILTVTSMTEGTLPPPVEETVEEIDEITALQLAVVEQYETNLALEEELTNVQLALVELYEGGL